MDEISQSYSFRTMHKLSMYPNIHAAEFLFAHFFSFQLRSYYSISIIDGAETRELNPQLSELVSGGTCSDNTAQTLQEANSVFPPEVHKR